MDPLWALSLLFADDKLEVIESGELKSGEQ